MAQAPLPALIKSFSKETRTIGGAENDLPDLQDSLRFPQIGKRQSSAEEPSDALVHRVEPVDQPRLVTRFS